MTLWVPCVHSAKGSERPLVESETVLVVTGNYRGQIKPCSCTSLQSGGVSHVSRFLTEFKRKLPKESDAVLLDAGNFGAVAPQLNSVLDVYMRVGYNAVICSETDLQMHPRIRQQLQDRAIPSLVQGQDPSGLELDLKGRSGKVVVSPLKYFNAGAIEGGRKRQEKALAVGLIESYNRPLDALLEKDPVVSDYDVLFARVQRPFRLGKTRIYPLPEHAQVVIVRLKGSGWEQESDYELLNISNQMPSDADLDAKFERIAKELTLAEAQRVQKRAAPVAERPAATCGGCHQAETAQWLTTGHAHALETLRKKDKLDLECLPCHSDTFRDTGYAQVLKEAKPADSVTCVTCHTGADRHAFTRRIADVVRKPAASICAGCHTKDNSPKFEYEAFLKRVGHTKKGTQE